MITLAGLGNPGKKFASSRHNLGFDVLDSIKKNYNFPDYKKKFSGLYSKKKINNNNVILIKPMTFMNCSGDCVYDIINFFKIPSNNLIVIHDDLDMKVSKVRIKKTGSHGGHNGIKDIISKIGNDFMRLKIGINSSNINNDKKTFVLSKFSKEERSSIDSVIKKLVNNFNLILKKDFNSLMNSLNNEF